MTREEIEKIAEAHGWRISPIANAAFSIEPKLFLQTMVATGSPDVWRLTDAGAFRVLIESEIEFKRSLTTGHWEAVACAPYNQFRIKGDSDPHEAIARAELSRLEATT